MGTQTDRWPPASTADLVMPYKRFARYLDALGITDPRVWHDDFLRYQTAWTTTITSSGVASTLGSGVRGGVVQLTSGASASSQAGLIMGSTSLPALVLNPTTEGWLIASRFKITTVPDAQAEITVGLLNVANTRFVGMGAFGNISTTKFSARIGTASIQSTVNLDTSWHTGVLFGAGSTTLYLSIDGETPVSGTMTGVPADAFLPFIAAGNGTTAAAQTLQVDDVTFVFGSN